MTRVMRPLNVSPFRLARGEYHVERITVTDTAGATVDLTGCTLYLRVKVNKTDADGAAVLELSTGDGIVHLTQSGATKGQADITFTSEQTSELIDEDADQLAEVTYSYDVWVVDGQLHAQPVIDPSALKVTLGVWDPEP